MGITRLDPEDLAGSLEPVLEWLRASGARKVAVHFDLDVLDPSLADYLLFHDPSAAPGAWDAVPKGRIGSRRSRRSSTRSRREPT